MLADKGISLEGKRCLITGSDSVSTDRTFRLVPSLHLFMSGQFCVQLCTSPFLLFFTLSLALALFLSLPLSPSINLSLSFYRSIYLSLLSLLNILHFSLLFLLFLSSYILQSALALAEKLTELGAIPLTFSDTSGFIYEPTGFDSAKVKTVWT